MPIAISDTLHSQGFTYYNGSITYQPSVSLPISNQPSSTHLKNSGRSGIRTHAGLTPRPDNQSRVDALDRLAILTWERNGTPTIISQTLELGI